MSNQIYGIITIIVSLLIYYSSWRFQKNESHKTALALLILGGLLLRIYTSTDFFLHAWDERYHALVAKNLLKHFLVPTLYDTPALPFDSKSWVGSHIWLHKQPLPLWTIAISIWAFGVNEIAVRIPSILISTLGIVLTFYIANYFSNKKVAYLAALLFSINGLIIELTGGRIATDHIDIFFLFFVELAIFFSIVFIKKGNTLFNILAGVSIGAAILCKWLPALIVLPIWLLIVKDSEKYNIKTIVFQFILLCGTTVLVFLPWQLYIYSVFPAEAAWEASFNMKHITQSLEEQGAPFYYFLTQIRINYGELIYIPVIWLFWKIYKNKKDLKQLAICIWFLIPILFFSFVQTKMQAYILFASPALFIVTAEFWFMLLDYKKTQKQKWFYNLALIAFLVLPVRYLIERMKPFDDIERNPQWAIDLKNLNKNNYIKGVLLNYNRPIEAMFYTNLTAYDYLPNAETINNLIKEGNTIIINNKGNIPQEITSNKTIIFEKLSE